MYIFYGTIQEFEKYNTTYKGVHPKYDCVSLTRSLGHPILNNIYTSYNPLPII